MFSPGGSRFTLHTQYSLTDPRPRIWLDDLPVTPAQAELLMSSGRMFSSISIDYRRGELFARGIEVTPEEAAGIACGNDPLDVLGLTDRPVWFRIILVDINGKPLVAS